MRKFHPIFYFWLIFFALTNSGCEYGVKVLEAVVNAVLEEETRLAYHQRRMQEVDGPGWTDLHRAAATGGVQVVLVSTGSIDALRRVYPNYFLDTTEFIKALDRISKKIK